MENAAEDSGGGGAEGDEQVEEHIDGPGPAGRWEMWVGRAGLSLVNGRGKAGASAGTGRRHQQ